MVLIENFRRLAVEFCVLCVCLCFDVVVMYATGAPSSACKTLLPGHGVDAQTIRPPYSIIVSETFYTPGAAVLTGNMGQRGMRWR